MCGVGIAEHGRRFHERAFSLSRAPFDDASGDQMKPKTKREKTKVKSYRLKPQQEKMLNEMNLTFVQFVDKAFQKEKVPAK